jgi:hypothetical protein
VLVVVLVEMVLVVLTLLVAAAEKVDCEEDGLDVPFCDVTVEAEVCVGLRVTTPAAATAMRRTMTKVPTKMMGFKLGPSWRLGTISGWRKTSQDERMWAKSSL